MNGRGEAMMRAWMARPACLVAAFAAVVAAGCRGAVGEAKDALEGGLDASAATDGGPLAEPFALGVEYTEVGLAASYAAQGITWAKTRLEAFSWGAVEKSAPSGGRHLYDWSCTDALVGEYQRAGITHLQSYLGSQSAWGSVSQSDVMPRAERMGDYRDWVQALVERYDGDGAADMPGLLAPVRHWVVGGEWTGFWGSGSDADYLVLLDATRQAARAADDGVQLGLIPFMMADVFAGNPPGAQQIAERLRDPPPAFRNSTAGMMRLLDRPDLFDYLDLHSLGDYTELAPMLAWTRAEMERRGYRRPVWIDDAFSGSMIANASWPLPYPVTTVQRAPVQRALLDVARLVEPAYSVALPWVRAEVARGMVKKAVVAAAQGAAGIHLGNTEDWMPDTDLLGLRQVATSLSGAAAMMGLADVTHPKGLAVCAPRTAGALRPAGRNLSLVTGALSGVVRIEPLAHNSGIGLWAFRLVRAEGSTVVAWHEDGVQQLPGEREDQVPSAIALPGAASARVTWAVEAQGAASRSQTLAVTSGALTLPLDGNPVFVEPH